MALPKNAVRWKAMCTCAPATGALAAYYSVTTWLPTFLETERHLSVTGRTGYVLMPSPAKRLLNFAT